MDSEDDLAAKFAVALVEHKGVTSAGAAKAQGEDIAASAFILAEAFIEERKKRAAVNATAPPPSVIPAKKGSSKK